MQQKRPLDWLDVRILVGVIFLFLVLRVINLDRWSLANVDEIALLNNLQLPIFSGGYGSTTFFPAVQITKALFFVKTFPDYRFIGVLFNLLGLIFFYMGLRKISGRISSLVGATAYASQWYLVYISRIYEIATFVPFFFALQFYLSVLWLTTRRNTYLILAFFIGGIGIDCYAPPLFYSSVSLLAICCFSAIRRELTWKMLVTSLVASIVAATPFIYVQLFVGNFRRDLLSNYQFAGHYIAHMAPIHILHPEIFLKTLAELLSFITLDHNIWKWSAGLVLGSLAISAVLFLQKRSDPTVRFVGTWMFLILGLAFLSPVAVYIQGHLTAFLILFLALNAVLLDCLHGYRRLVPGILLIGLVSASLFWLPNIFNDQWREVEWANDFIQQAGDTPVPISDGAFLALRQTPGFLSDKVRIFTCASEYQVQQGLKDLPCEKPFLIVATFDCNIVTAMTTTCANISDEQRVTTLMESHLANGIVFYRTSPKGRGRGEL